ncbi:MAG: hypothetical protein A2X48_22120 [Lentisphaerae bacterium GWF2_49_21]|nr:MAG: hypothetical protein A2X48_22120 [Lentisphaerae bacterium GWF2_49_21]
MKIDKLIAENKYTVWLALGDSITEYNHCAEGYANYLQHFDNHLRLKFGKSRFMIANSAVGGSNLTKDLEFALDQIERFNPGFVTAMYGMNDSSNGEKGLVDFKTSLNSLCAFLKKRKIPSVILTQNPIDFGCAIQCIQSRKDFPLYEKAIAETVKKAGIECIDIYSIWKKEILDVNPNEHFKLLHDGIHPNHKGHEYIFNIMKRTMLR